MSIERLRWIWWQWTKHHCLRICAQHHHSARCDDSDDAFRQHAYYTGKRADQLAGRAAAHQHSTGYTAGDARGQKR
jgi:hypothetical protein